MKISFNKKNYVLDIDKALSLGVLKEKFIVKNEPLQAGDVFKAHGSVPNFSRNNPFLLVKVVYGMKYEGTDDKYQLVGLGAAVNSGSFFESLHSLEEIENYLSEYKMVFVKNINREIETLVRH